MNNLSIVFRIKGGELIGFGHLFRTLAIAEEFRKKEISNIFFIINNSESLKLILSQYQFPFSIAGSINEEADVKLLIPNYDNNVQYIFLIDTKDDVSQEIELFKKLKGKIVLIDNYTPARLISEINVYPIITKNFQSLPWQNYVGKLFYGHQYVPITERILRFREKIVNFQNRKSIFISFGGTDPNNLTQKVISALIKFDETVDINVMVGHAFLHAEDLKQSIRECPRNITVHQNTVEIGALMCSAGLAITALGTTIYELAYLGVPTVIISNFQGDAADEVDLSQNECFKVIGYHEKLSENDLHRIICDLWNQSEYRQIMSFKGLELIDGTGAKNIVKKVLQNIDY